MIVVSRSPEVPSHAHVIRAGLAAALLALAVFPALAADKAFQRKDLDDAAIKLEAQIKSDAGTVTKPAAALRRDADAAFQKNDFRTGMLVLGQVVAAAPNDAASWLRLVARHPADQAARRPRKGAAARSRLDRRLYRLSARAATATWKPTAWRCSAARSADRKQWRRRSTPLRLSLDLRETADLRGQYERLRVEHGFRFLDYSVDSDADFTARLLPVLRRTARPAHRFLAVRGGRRRRQAGDLGQRQAALRRRPQARRALQHHAARRPAVDGARDAGEVGRVHHLRARPQAVRALFRQGLCAAAYRPARHSAAQRQHQRGRSVDLSHRRPQSDRDRARATTSSAISATTRPSGIGSERGAKVWSGELAVEQKLNTEVTTAFPVGEALGDLGPGVYAMTAAPKEAVSDDYDQLATQWFIVSDLGLTAYSGHDGVDVFMHSLASAEPSAAGRRAADRAQQRGAGGQADRRATALCISRPGSRAARAALRRPRSSPARRATTPFSA